MRGPLELVVFVGLAAAAHAAVIVAVSGDAPGLPPGSGAGGESGITLAALPGLEATVADWDRTPEVSPAPRAPAVAAPNGAPEIARPVSAVEFAAVPDATGAPEAPDGAGFAIPAQPAALATADATPPRGLAAPGASGAQPVAPGQVAAVTRGERAIEMAALDPQVAGFAAPEPPAPPRRLPERADSAPPARPAFEAAGAGGGAVSGQAPAQPVTQETAAKLRAPTDPKLMARWGARIGAQIEARKLSPRGDWRPGKAVLRLVVGRDGRLQSVSVVQSAGDVRLDRAALQAVRRAGRLPAAPKGFADESATFTLPATFTR